MRISDWSSDVCSSDLTFKDGRKNGAWRGKIIAALRYDTTGRGREHGRGFGIEKATRFRKRKAFLIPRFHRIRIGREPRLGMGDQLSSRNDLIHNLQLQGLSRLHRTATEDRKSTRLNACDRSEEHTSELQSLMRISY